MGNFSKVEPSYISKDGCRLVWSGVDEDDSDVVVLKKDELDKLTELLSKDATGKVELEDGYSTILVNTDTTQFFLRDHKILESKTQILAKKVLEFRNIPHQPKPVKIYPKEFLPSVQIETDVSSEIDAVLVSEKLAEGDLFRVMATRRSTRNFDTSRIVEEWKIDKILAAADTAPSAGNFQGFEVFYIKNREVKKMLVEAANNQPYVNAPAVLVFCMNPSRVKMDLEPQILSKFSLQDATLAASYAQLAASALGLSSIWIGMINEQKVMEIIGTDLRPSSILCVGYPGSKKPPKSRRKLRDLVHVV